MRIIDEEIGEHTYGKMEWPIVRRVIHATADFDFAGTNKMLFDKGAITNGIKALKDGRSIVVDVNGVIGGFNKQNPRDFANDIVCMISDPGIAEIAKKESLTRSQASMRASASAMDNGVVVIGNAPTALREVIRMVRQGMARPALIVGIPVGFVGAAESKQELAGQDGTPYITNVGRKGGSPAASAIVNALYKLLRNQ